MFVQYLSFLTEAALTSPGMAVVGLEHYLLMLVWWELAPVGSSRIMDL